MCFNLKKKCFYLIFSFLSVLCNAQNAEIDDLLRKLRSTKKNDSIKVNILNDLAWEFTRIDSDKALQYGVQAKKISQQISYRRGAITSDVRVGTIAIYQKRMDDAESIFLKVLEDEQKEQYIYGIGRAQNQLGRIYNAKGDFDNALKFYKAALESFESLGRKSQMALVNNNIGVIYKKIGSYDIALKYYLKSLEVRRQLKNKKRIAFTLSNIGSLLISLEDYTKAIDYLKESEGLLKEYKQLYELSKVSTNLGVASFRIGKLEEALSYYNKALKLNEDLGFSDKNINVFNNIGSLYYKKEDLDLASVYYQKSLATQKKYKTEENQAGTYCSLGNVEFKRKAYDQAITYYQSSLNLARKYNNKSIELESEKNISLSYSFLKEYDKAFEHNLRYSKLKDSVENASKKAIFLNHVFEEDQMEMELLVKESQIAKSNSEKARTINISLGILFFLLIILLISVIWGNKEKRKADIALLERQKVEELLKDQELKSINAMIEGQEEERQRIARDLHDRLGSILSMVKVHFKSVEDHIEELKASNKSQYDKANQLLDDACDEVRKISHNIASGILTKFGLVAALEDLKDTIEETKKIKVEFIAHGIYDRLDNNVEITVYRIIQELVSNILKHAEAENITIQIINREKDLHISVEDDGKGFDTNNKEHEGIGLKNVMSRVDSLDGELYIDSMINKGTSVSIEVPNKEI